MTSDVNRQTVMAYYDFSADYNGGVETPETEIAHDSYDDEDMRRFLCDGAAGRSSCDFGYADWPADGNGTELPTTADPNALEQVTHSQAWSENTG